MVYFFNSNFNRIVCKQIVRPLSTPRLAASDPCLLSLPMTYKMTLGLYGLISENYNNILNQILLYSKSLYRTCRFWSAPSFVYIHVQLLTYVEVDMECYWTVNVILTDAEVSSITLHAYRIAIVLLYNTCTCMLCISCHFGPLKQLTYGWIMRNYLTFWRHFP